MVASYINVACVVGNIDLLLCGKFSFWTSSMLLSSFSSRWRPSLDNSSDGVVVVAFVTTFSSSFFDTFEDVLLFRPRFPPFSSPFCSLKWILLCFVKWSERVNPLSQFAHLKRFSPVCVLWCRDSSSDLVKLFPHIEKEQRNGLSPLCHRRCAFRCDVLP